MSTTVERFLIALDDGSQAVLGESEAAERLLRERLEQSGALRVRVARRDEVDTQGHALAPTVVPITLEIEGDTEGHAFSLRFPTADAARDFERRLLATGLLVGAVAATAVGVGVGQAAHSQTTGTVAAPISVPAPARDTDKLEIMAPAPARDVDKLDAVAPAGVPARDTDKLDISVPAGVSTTSRDTDKLDAVAPAGVPGRDTDKLDASSDGRGGGRIIRE